jgi:hypothetical protein
VDPAYLNLSDLYDIKYLPFEFMIFRRVPKPLEQQEPLSPEAEAGEGLAEFSEASWPWPGELGLEITEESEDLEALLGEATAGRKRTWSPTRSLFQFPRRNLPAEEEPVELGLRQRVKASMAHISRILKGRLEGDSPHDSVHLCVSPAPMESPCPPMPRDRQLRVSSLVLDAHTSWLTLWASTRVLGVTPAALTQPSLLDI